MLQRHEFRSRLQLCPTAILTRLDSRLSQPFQCMSIITCRPPFEIPFIVSRSCSINCTGQSPRQSSSHTTNLAPRGSIIPHVDLSFLRPARTLRAVHTGNEIGKYRVPAIKPYSGCRRIPQSLKSLFIGDHGQFPTFASRSSSNSAFGGMIGIFLFVVGVRVIRGESAVFPE